MRVDCEVEEVILEWDDGPEIDGVQVTCGRCDHQAEAFGTSDRSVRYYVADGSDD